MKRNPYYQLKYISGVPYLVAFGQAAADFGHDLRLNETSLFLWNALETVSSENELVSLYIEKHNCSPKDHDSIVASVHSFLAALLHQGLLLPENYDISDSSPCMTLEIAGLFCRLYGEKECFSDKLFEFETTNASFAPELTQEISIQTGLPPYNKTGKLILQNNELYIFEDTDEYYLFFPAFKYITEAHLSLDGKKASIFCKLAQTEECKQESFSVMQILFLYFAGIHNILAIHSASVLYRDKVWLFSAASGVGKSTHTNLWNTILNVPIINGDVNLIALDSGAPVVHGLPWCGTSEIATQGTYPLGGIILLLRGTDNEVISLPEAEQLLFLLHRNISPAWDNSMQDRNLDILNNIYNKIFIRRFACAPTEAAVNTIRAAIDDYLSKN